MLKTTELFGVRFFKVSNASGANVCVDFLAVFKVRNFLYVYFERSSRFTVGVADVVAGSLTFTANVTYSGHIDTSDLEYIFYRSETIKTPRFYKEVLFDKKRA